MTIAYIGLGSNLDNPVGQVERAIRSLSLQPECRLLQVSNFYSSLAVGPGSQPDYVNACVALETSLAPETLLDALQKIEFQQGRARSEIRWTARTLDLDIVLYGDLMLESERLRIPHPYAKQRNFVLLPLYDIAPELVFPCGERLRDLLLSAPRDGICRLSAAL